MGESVSTTAIHQSNTSRTTTFTTTQNERLGHCLRVGDGLKRCRSEGYAWGGGLEDLGHAGNAKSSEDQARAGKQGLRYRKGVKSKFKQRS